jgi:hypothetical protein
VSFSSGSVVVQNWVVLNSMATADQINQTQSTLFDAFQQNGYETDDFIMVIDPSYANGNSITVMHPETRQAGTFRISVILRSS